MPAWVLGLLGPEGAGRRGIAGNPLLINTDLRSYIALGGPESEEEPVVDHKGGIIPLPGSFTLLFGTIINDRAFYSSEKGEVKVELHEDGFPLATVTWNIDNDVLLFNVIADKRGDNEVMMINVIRGFENHQLLISLLPFDQEGITKVPLLEYDTKGNIVIVGETPKIFISEQPIHAVVSELADGHAGRLISDAKNQNVKGECAALAASWAASFPVRANPSFVIPLKENTQLEEYKDLIDWDDLEDDWLDLMAELPQIDTSDSDVNHFFKTSAIVLRLLSDVSKNEVTIGPSLQEEMWLPGLVFQLKALERLGFGEKIVQPTLENVLNKVDTNGIIATGSQWDSQGAIVLATLNHYFFTADQDWVGAKYNTLKRVADWVNRQMKKETENLLKGLLPPGTPAWHNPLYWQLDYYYFNNFWAISVLKNLNILATELGRHGEAVKFKDEMDEYYDNLNDSITKASLNAEYMPAGPFLKDSSEMIFNLHAFYPLKLYPASNQQLLGTLKHLWEYYVVEGGVLIDQPWNAYGTYLSILIAQASRYIGKVEHVNEVINFLVEKSTNRQGWAEGISPLTGLGSVGDSPNGYTSAEYINLILDIFIEENWNEPTILLKGIPQKWLEKGVKAENLNLFNGKSGSVEAKLNKNNLTIKWNLDYEEDAPKPQIFIPNLTSGISEHIVQISNNLYELPGINGELTFKYL